MRLFVTKVPQRLQKVVQKRPNGSKAPQKGSEKTHLLAFLKKFDLFSTISSFCIVVASIWLLLALIGSYWLLLAPIGSYWFLLLRIVSYCLFAAPIVSYWLLMAPLAPLVSYWLLLVLIRSYWLLLALYFPKKKRASRLFDKTGFPSISSILMV